MSTKTYPVQKSEAEWQKELDPQQYKVLRKHATERAGRSPLNHEKRKGERYTAPAAAAISATSFPMGRSPPASAIA
jgi:peptide methionine sulfoxide reductase MsrB